jgi:hypothetical protein
MPEQTLVAKLLHGNAVAIDQCHDVRHGLPQLGAVVDVLNRGRFLDAGENVGRGAAEFLVLDPLDELLLDFGPIDLPSRDMVVALQNHKLLPHGNNRRDLPPLQPESDLLDRPVAHVQANRLDHSPDARAIYVLGVLNRQAGKIVRLGR